MNLVIQLLGMYMSKLNKKICKSSLKYLCILLLFIILAVFKNLFEMFKESDSHTQLDMFSSPAEYFKDPEKKRYLKNDFWHNRFRKEVVARVDESIFSPQRLGTRVDGDDCQA